MKKAMAIIMALVLVMSVGIVPSAALSTSAGSITAEEFAAKVKAEYSKYGIEYEVLKSGPKKVLTTKMLEEELARVNDIGKQYLKEREVEKAEIAQIKKSMGKEVNLQSSADSVLRGSMFINKSFKYDKTFTEAKGFGNATIRMQLDTTCAADSKEFISVSNITSYQYGIATNFSSWTETNSWYNLSRKALAGFIQGRLSFQYSEPHTGATVTSTSNREFTCTWTSSSI